MVFFLGSSLGATLTTAVLTIRADATSALNLLLMLPAAIGLTLTGGVPGRRHSAA